MLKSLVKKERQGTLLAILLFAIMIAIMSFGTTAVANTLYASNKETATRYSHIQSYRSATEIACYQYLNDMQALIVTKSLTGEWVSVSGSAVYTQAIDAIVEQLGTAEDAMIWRVSTIENAIGGASVSDPAIVTNLLGLLAEGRVDFQLRLADYPEIDWEAGESYVGRDESQLKLKPFEIIVDLTAKGEVLKERLFVDGLFLNVLQSKVNVPGGGRDTLVTMSIVPSQEGVQIYRE